MSLHDVARSLTEEFIPNVMEVGKYYLFEGRPVKIIDGRYWGTYGLSNHWHWKEVLPDGSLSKEDESGYGGTVFKRISKERALRIAKNRGNRNRTRG